MATDLATGWIAAAVATGAATGSLASAVRWLVAGAGWLTAAAARCSHPAAAGASQIAITEDVSTSARRGGSILPSPVADRRMDEVPPRS